MSRARRSEAFAERMKQLDELLSHQPCRQKTQECAHNGDCLRCGAWTGEACKRPT